MAAAFRDKASLTSVRAQLILNVHAEGTGRHEHAVAAE